LQPRCFRVMHHEAHDVRADCDRHWCVVLTQVYKNALLNAMGDDIVSRLRLTPVTFELGREMEFPGQPIRNLFFLEEGMASMTTTFEDGSQVEVGMFGFESVVGISALMGTKLSLNRIYTQIAGSGYSVLIADGRKEFLRAGLFQSLVLRYVQAQLVQTAQSAGCNAKHSAEQRLARWLLICTDRAHSDSFAMSHESISSMLGSTRSTVTLAAGTLKDKKLIGYSRGMLHILDRAGLQVAACECYHVIKNHLDNYLEYDSGLAE